MAARPAPRPRSSTGRTADRAVHGDAWPGNIVRTVDGVLMMDLERFSVGPPEWDLVSTAVRAMTTGAVSMREYDRLCAVYGYDVTARGVLRPRARPRTTDGDIRGPARSQPHGVEESGAVPDRLSARSIRPAAVVMEGDSLTGDQSPIGLECPLFSVGTTSLPCPIAKTRL